MIHEDASRRLLVDRDKVPKGILAWATVFSAAPNILVMADWIENAREVHVMDSCVFHMTEQLNPKGRLFLHQYVRMQTPLVMTDNCSSRSHANYCASDISGLKFGEPPE